MHGCFSLGRAHVCNTPHIRMDNMINSMTGYGRYVGSFPGGEITAEIKAVNNRYLDTTVKLPRAYSYAEDAIKSLVSQKVSRGKLDVMINISTVGTPNLTVSLNEPMVEGYLAAMRQMKEKYGIQGEPSLEHFVRLNDIFTLEKVSEDENEVKEALLSAVSGALDEFNAMRSREGEALKADLLMKADALLEIVSRVEARSPLTVSAYHQRLLNKLQEVLSDSRIDEARIVQEAAIFADKVAVDEETVRLRSHVSQFRDMLLGGGVIGRKLDFLMQEMNREANTIGSKGNDAEQARNVVELKSELEKIREQIQNIE